MKTELDSSLQSRWLLAVLGIFLAATATGAALSPRTIVPDFSQHVHLTTDWSHRHMIFSAPKTLRQAFNLSANPRYVQQWNRRYAERRGIHPKVLHRDAIIKGDWSTFIGANGTLGAGMYPAKFSFDINNADCINDFVVFGSNTTGSASNNYAQGQIVVYGQVPAGDMLPIYDIHGDVLTLTAAATNANMGSMPGPPISATGTFASDLNPTAQAADIAAAINIPGNGSSISVTATSVVDPYYGPMVIMTVTGAGNSGTTGNSWHYVNGPTGQNPFDSGQGLTPINYGSFSGGTEHTASISAMNNLYKGCGGDPQPNPFFAYDTGGAIHTSVVLSLDGSQIAFVQSIGGVANLSVLKWATVTGGLVSGSNVYNTGVATPVAPAAFRACVPVTGTSPSPGTPCLTDVAFNLGNDDTNSSPYYDYNPGSDTLYVGDDGGYLHKFTGIFTGTPAEDTTSPWPVYLGSGLRTTGPVYDSGSGNIFIADGDASATPTLGGYLHAVSAASGTVITSAKLANTSGIVDSPTVDSTNGAVFVAYADGVNGMTDINQFSETFLAGGLGVPIAIGVKNPRKVSYTGDFDNAYVSSGTGYMYACGNDGTAGNIPTLYQIPAVAGVLGPTATPGPALTGAPSICSPVTEVYNSNAAPAKDWIFLSVQGPGLTGSTILCPSPNAGCLMSFNVTSGTGFGLSTPAAATAAVNGGTSGIIIDNIVSTGGTLPGASQVYFTPLNPDEVCPDFIGGFGGCGIQVSQANLQ